MSVEYLEEWRQKLANISKSKSQSMQKQESGQLGQELTDEELAPLVAIYMTLDKAWRNPFTTKGNFARYAADQIAICACEGLITTRLEEEVFGNRWHITEDGLMWMRGFDDAFTIRH